MFEKIQKVILNKKFLMILLSFLAIAGCFFAVYFGIRMRKAEKMTSVNCVKSIERVNAYGTLLDKSYKLVRQKRGLEVLEEDIRALNNGTLLAAWQSVVWGGNKHEDLNDYFDTILDSIIFFSK